MNHPRIATRHLSDNCIKDIADALMTAIADALMTDFYCLKQEKAKVEMCISENSLTDPGAENAIALLNRQMDLVINEHNKIQRAINETLEV